MSFRTILGKFENQQKTLGKWFWTNFVKKISEIVGKFSVNVRYIFVFAINKLFTNRIARAVQWNTKSSFFTHGPRKLSPYFKISDLVFHGAALASG